MKYVQPDDFRRVLRARVDEFFASGNRRTRDCPQMYLKTAIVLAWILTAYVLLLLFAGTWWAAIPLAVVLGLGMAAAGFNIQHDGAHGAYSNRRWVNKLTSMMLDLLGASSYIWARKHNSIHHSYTNVTGHDDDINVGFLGRLSPHQKRLWFQRAQHFYMWALYGFLPVKWHFIDDFRDVIRGRIGDHRLPRPTGLNLALFIGGKVLFFSLALGLPILLHPVWSVLALYLIASFVQGVALSVVFQMAHCVEEAEFPMPQPATSNMETSWAVHQVETTVNFAPRTRLISWFVGGLNFQIEHHLFPQICHIHYPDLAPIIKRTCREFGLRYRSHRTIWGAIASHFRWLRRMGQPDGPNAAVLA